MSELYPRSKLGEAHWCRCARTGEAEGSPDMITGGVLVDGAVTAALTPGAGSQIE
jgi:hypothetical protein